MAVSYERQVERARQRMDTQPRNLGALESATALLAAIAAVSLYLFGAVTGWQAVIITAAPWAITVWREMRFSRWVWSVDDDN